MKFTTVVSGLALATAVSAEPALPGRGFSFNFNPFANIASAIASYASAAGINISIPTGLAPGRPTNVVIPTPATTTARASSTSAPITVVSGSATATQTGAASYGSFVSVWPTWSTAKPTATVTPNNSTSGDAGTNPLLSNSPTHRGNWLPGFDINTDYNTLWPTTGNTVKYTLTIQNVTLSPEGVPRQMLAINGQYPGPKIEANWGDFIEITVTNAMANNGTGLHWHGLRQLNTNPQDGVVGVTECPIAPGDTKTYLFQATQYGTSWYHSHFSVQYGDGVAGPIVINGPASANYDIDLGTVMLADLYSQTAFQADYYAHRNGPPTATNNLINGQNIKVDGSAGSRPSWTFTTGKKHRLRIVNTAKDALYKVSIDGHKFQVIQTDFVPIVPYNTSELSVAIGQRYDIIVDANQLATNYWFRVMPALDCTFSANNGKGNANGIIKYSTAASASLPTTTYGNHTDTCVDEPYASLVPVVSKSVDSGSFATVASNLPVNIQVVSQTDGIVFQWTLGGISQVVDWSNPTIGQAVLSNNTYSAVKHVVQLPTANVWTYWIVQNQFFVPHPLHLHGHDFSLLGQGSGTFNPATDMSKLTFKNPPRRDVAMLVASGWTVIAFETDNPGAWLLHCHIAWHAGEGLSLQYLERPADIPSLYKTLVQAQPWQSTCANWNKYAPTAVWKQYDSGLKKRTLSNGMEVFDMPTLPPRADVGRRASHAHGHVRRSRQFRR